MAAAQPYDWWGAASGLAGNLLAANANSGQEPPQNVADPFAAQRAQYQPQLASLMSGGGVAPANPNAATMQATATGGGPYGASMGAIATGQGGQIGDAQQQLALGGTPEQQKMRELAMQAGNSSTTQLLGMTQPGGGAFTSTDPSYQWRFDQGREAVDRSASAAGMGNSGNVLAELTKYGQGMASQEYGAQFSRLSDLARLQSGQQQQQFGQLRSNVTDQFGMGNTLQQQQFNQQNTLQQQQFAQQEALQAAKQQEFHNNFSRLAQLSGVNTGSPVAAAQLQQQQQAGAAAGAQSAASSLLGAGKALYDNWGAIKTGAGAIGSALMGPPSLPSGTGFGGDEDIYGSWATAPTDALSGPMNSPATGFGAVDDSGYDIFKSWATAPTDTGAAIADSGSWWDSLSNFSPDAAGSSAAAASRSATPQGQQSPATNPNLGGALQTLASFANPAIYAGANQVAKTPTAQGMGFTKYLLKDYEANPAMREGMNNEVANFALSNIPSDKEVSSAMEKLNSIEGHNPGSQEAYRIAKNTPNAELQAFPERAAQYSKTLDTLEASAPRLTTPSGNSYYLPPGFSESKGRLLFTAKPPGLWDKVQTAPSKYTPDDLARLQSTPEGKAELVAYLLPSLEHPEVQYDQDAPTGQETKSPGQKWWGNQYVLPSNPDKPDGGFKEFALNVAQVLTMPSGPWATIAKMGTNMYMDSQAPEATGKNTLPTPAFLPPTPKRKS